VGPRALGSAECPTGAGDAGRSLLHRKSPIGRGLFLFAVLAPLAIAFAWQGQLASFGDDSASYLTLANYFSPSGDPIVSEWAGYHANFPPLLPLLLAITGGVHNLHMAYVLVALFGAAGVALFYRYAALELGRTRRASRGDSLPAHDDGMDRAERRAERVALSVRIDGEPRVLPEANCERQPSTGEWLLFGFLLACAALSRAIGILLLGAYLVHLAVAAWKERRLVARAWIPAIVVVVLVGLWYAFRPKAPTDMYGVASTWVMGWWLGNPGEMLHGATNLLFSGWVRSFMADHDVTLGAKIVFGAVGVLGFVEALLRAKRNRLDGWFVLLSLGVIFVWTFTPETTRRLLYPLVPLMILYAMSITRRLLAKLRLDDRRGMLVSAAIVALPVLLVLPALAIVARNHSMTGS
jgi:hypothetical protein